jgi:hypothetical protein
LITGVFKGFFEFGLFGRLPFAHGITKLRSPGFSLQSFLPQIAGKKGFSLLPIAIGTLAHAWNYRLFYRNNQINR